MTASSRVKSARLASLGAALTLLFLLPTPPAFPFYQHDEDGASISMKASIRALGIASEYPDDPLIYKNRTETLGGGMFRLTLDASWEGAVAVELNAYALGYHNSSGSGSSTTITAQNPERSPALERGLFKNSFSKGEAALDWASVRFTHGAADLKIGRQPVNLSSALYFTPNDFFAPFGAEIFYRVYKAGVDAARLETSLGGLTQLTCLAVAGYDADAGSLNGYTARPDPKRTSYVARLTTVAFDSEFTAVAGKVRRAMVYGGAYQGTFIQWLGVRMEGHWVQPLDRGDLARGEAALELERLYPNSLSLRLALFHHGAGVESASLYMERILSARMESPYLARRYAAVGAGYEFSPLLTGQALALVNLVDRSFNLSLNAVYSLADEGELFLGLSLPFGEKPEGMVIKSENGARPMAGSLEVRYYF